MHGYAGVNLLEYSQNYCNVTDSLCFWWNNEPTSFNSDNVNSDNLKSFKYVGKLLQNRVADGTRIILRNATVTLALKYLSNFWRSLEMVFI